MQFNLTSDGNRTEVTKNLLQREFNVNIPVHEEGSFNLIEDHQNQTMFIEVNSKLEETKIDVSLNKTLDPTPA